MRRCRRPHTLRRDACGSESCSCQAPAQWSDWKEMTLQKILPAETSPHLLLWPWPPADAPPKRCLARCWLPRPMAEKIESPTRQTPDAVRAGQRVRRYLSVLALPTERNG